MEHNDYLLDSFSSSMIQYLNQILIDENCVSYNFRKYSVKNEKDLEFSFILKSTINPSLEDKSIYPIKSACLTEEELNRLKIVSQSWCLHIFKLFIRENSLYLKLNRPQAFFAVLNSILSKKSDYGKYASFNQTIKVTCDDFGGQMKDLTTFRSFLVKESAKNILKSAGYTYLSDLCENEEIKWIHYSTKNEIRDQMNIGNKVTTVCAPVLNARTGTKEMAVTQEEYRTLRFGNLQKIYESKNLEMTENDDKNKVLNALTDSCVKLTFLHVKISQPIALKLDPDFEKNLDSGNKGGTFVLYNVSRLESIKKKYFQGVRDGFYPMFTDPQETDFSVLNQSEEWALLFNFLLEYPTLISGCAKDLVSGKPAIHRITQFIFSLCSLFSVYYRKYRVLQEPKEHLMPLLKARLFLVMSIEQVLENSLTLLGIEKIQAM